MVKPRLALGRGLSALVSAAPSYATPSAPAAAFDGSSALKSEGAELNGVQQIKIDQIKPNPTQPRVFFSDSDLEELTQSIKVQGVLQPVLLRKTSFGYEIVAGERRFRASQKAGLTEIPALVRDLSDKETLEISIIENVQRADLNPIEEAKAYERLTSEFSLTQAQISERVGKDRATVANLIRLLKLCPDVLKLLEAGEISPGHGKVLLSLKDPAGQLNLAKKVTQEKMSVRALETLVAQVEVLDGGKASSKPMSLGGKKPQGKATLPEVEDKLRHSLGTKVSLKHQASGKGKIEIEYYSTGELDRILDLITGGSSRPI